MDYFVFVVPLVTVIGLHFSELHLPIGFCVVWAIILTIPFIVLAKWPKRFGDNNERKYLLKQKRHTVIGVIGAIAKYDTGETKPVRIIDGYTTRFFSLDIYEHYHIEHKKIYEGYEAIVYLPDKAGKYFSDSFIILRTLPPTFFYKTDHFPRIDKNNMIERKITYVEDFDGEKYYIPDQNAKDILYDDDIFDI